VTPTGIEGSARNARNTFFPSECAPPREGASTDDSRTPRDSLEFAGIHKSESGPTVEALRAKLDIAIMAEQWDAVRTIKQRIDEVERAAAGNVVPIDSRRGKR
jgi:hypothetical protein